MRRGDTQDKTKKKGPQLKRGVGRDGGSGDKKSKTLLAMQLGIGVIWRREKPTSVLAKFLKKGRDLHQTLGGQGIAPRGNEEEGGVKDTS